MADYLLEIHYAEDEAPVRLELSGVTADEAENTRQSVVKQIEHAVDVEAPSIVPDLGSSGPGADSATVEAARVTRVDLVEAGEDG